MSNDAQDNESGNAFTREEVDSGYTEAGHRFVVSLILGYGGDDDAIDTPQLALVAARNDAKCLSWSVYDRQTGEMHAFTVEEVEQHMLREMVTVLLAPEKKNYTEAEARELAASTLGLKWSAT